MYVDLYLLKDFSNYFNRKVKRRESLTEYLDGLVEGEDYFILPYTNFNPNDGVSTSHIVGSATKPFTPEWQPDYCLVVGGRDGQTPPVIYSRWFVTEFVRTMSQQYSMALKRDTPADKYNILEEAPCYIQKATIPSNNPLIVNSEGMNLNQRKVAEYLLRDKSKVPWVVVYLAPNIAQDGIAVNVGLPPNIPDLETDTSDEAKMLRKMFLEGGSFATEYDHSILLDLNSELVIRTRQYYSIWQGTNWYGVKLGQQNASVVGWQNGAGQEGGLIDYSMLRLFSVGTGADSSVLTPMNNLSRDLKLDYANFWNYIKLQHPDISKSEIIDGDIKEVEAGKVWKYGQSYYEVIKDDYRTLTTQLYLNTTEQDYLHKKMSTHFTGWDVANGDKALRFNDIKIRYVHYRLQLKQGLTAQVDIKANRIHPEEVPYDIIAFPYDKIFVKTTSQGEWGKFIDDTVSLAAARSIAVALAPNQGCYDVQILPYCPVLNQYIDSDGDIDLEKDSTNPAIKNIHYCVVYKDDELYTIGFYCHSAYQSLTGDNAIKKLYSNGIEYDVGEICQISGDGRKVDNECDVWRLCAPNFMAQFEFKLTKLIELQNNTPLDHFDVDITYRPYQPYIRVAPQFDFLYVTDYKDARGLICSAGFSITLVDDKWQTYQLNNKNYQAMFNREIANMEVNRAISREQEQWNISQAWTSAITGMVGGGIAGFLASEINPLAGVGVGIGAISRTVNAGMGVATAYKQADWAERAYQENRDFKLDMFNMSLDNIKALPASITQSSSISYNFKFFPVLEKYTCTDSERQMVKSKIRWNGMTVGVIGRIKDYISNTEERYVQGQLIRLDGLGEDSHLANDLYNEVNKGLFFEPYLPPNKEVK